MNQPSSSTPPSSIVRNGRVAIDLPCDACGYPLGGLSLQERCPECGREVASAIPLPSLLGKGEDYLAGAALGTRLALAGTLLLLFGHMAAVVGVAITPRGFGLSLVLLLLSVAAAALVLLTTAAWMFIRKPLPVPTASMQIDGHQMHAATAGLLSGVVVVLAVGFPILSVPMLIAWIAMNLLMLRRIGSMANQLGRGPLLVWTRERPVMRSLVLLSPAVVLLFALEARWVEYIVILLLGLPLVVQVVVLWRFRSHINRLHHAAHLCAKLPAEPTIIDDCTAGAARAQGEWSSAEAHT